MNDSDIIVLQPATNGTIHVNYSTIKSSKTLVDLIEDAGIDHPVPVPNVEHAIMIKIIEFLKGINDSTVTLNDVEPFDKDLFCDNMDITMVFDLIRVSNYLDIQTLLDVTTTKVAKIIKGKSVYEICKTFNIENNFTDEEREEARKANEWCEER